MEYYAIINGQQIGPMSKERLLSAGLTPECNVWCAGMSGWQPASTVSDLSDLFVQDSAFGAYARPEELVNPYNSQQPRQPVDPYQQGMHSQYYGNQTQNPYNQPKYGNTPVNHTNWMPWAIIGTVVGALFSCIGMIFGIIGIVKASNANTCYQRGMYQEGDVANSTAKTMTIIALVIGGLGLIFGIAMIGTYVSVFNSILNGYY